MNKKKIILSVLSVLVLVFELLPYGVVLNFGNPEGEPLRETFSYFSLIPYGYANIGPFITAILTCFLIILIIVGWFKFGKKLNLAIMWLSGIAMVFSLFPLFLGFEYISMIGIYVSLMLGIIFGICFLKGEK